MPALALEMVRRKPDVLVTNGTPATLALKAATSTIPIVMTAISDPVATAVVKSLARPDANITGTTFFVQELVAKRLEMLREVLPKMSRAALPSNPGNTSTRTTLRDMATVAKTLRIEVRNFDVSRPDEFDYAFAAMKAWGAEAVVIVDDPVLNANPARLGALATARRPPHRPHPQGRQARRPADRATDHLRGDPQPEGRPGARHQVFAVVAGTRR